MDGRKVPITWPQAASNLCSLVAWGWSGIYIQNKEQNSNVTSLQVQRGNTGRYANSNHSNSWITYDPDTYLCYAKWVNHIAAKHNNKALLLPAYTLLSDSITSQQAVSDFILKPANLRVSTSHHPQQSFIILWKLLQKIKTKNVQRLRLRCSGLWHFHLHL